ncbi:MAG: hypothetical protein ACXW1M_08775 [Acidimicrobiia bacterium]
MTNAVLTPLGYEDGFRRGLAWASGAPVIELQELVESARRRTWTTIPVHDDWTSLRVELAPFVGDDGSTAVLRREPFVVGFVESASFLFWDPESIDDDLTD